MQWLYSFFVGLDLRASGFGTGYGSRSGDEGLGIGVCV